MSTTSRPSPDRLSSIESKQVESIPENIKEKDEINVEQHFDNEVQSIHSSTMDPENPQGRHMGIFSATFLMVNRIVGTGVFAATSILLSRSGSVGISLLYWVIDAIIAAAGFAEYAKFATAMPRNGGELNYLQRAFPKPRHLIPIMYASQALLHGRAAGNAYTAGQYFI